MRAVLRKDDAGRGTAMAVYSLFSIVALAVPIAAHRLGRPLAHAWGSRGVLLASLLMLGLIVVGYVAIYLIENWAALLAAVLSVIDALRNAS